MSFDKHIQDKFSGFEPEVPEEQIDAGWEKIKYFLPPEEKKKRAFFFYRVPMGMGIAALVVAVVSALGFLLMKEQGKSNTLSAIQRTKPAMRTALLKNTGTDHKTSIPASEKNPGLETAPVAALAFEQKQESKTPAVAHSTPLKLSNARSRPSGAFKNKGSTNDPKTDTHHISSSDTEAFSSVPHTETSTNRDSILVRLPHPGESPRFMMLMKQVALDQKTLLSAEPEFSLLSAQNIVTVVPNNKKPALELFAGLNNKAVQLQAVQDKKIIQAKGFSAGIAAIFPVKSKLYLSGQFIFSYNPVHYREETEADAIIKRTVVPSTNLSLSNYKDTLISYVPYTSTIELQSGPAYNLSGGVGYQLLNKGHISLDGSLFLNFKWMRYNYRVSRINADTSIFVSNILTPNTTLFYESVEKSPAPEPVSYHKQVMAFGINPCLNLVYQLNKKTGLILRPAYLLQLSPTTIHANDQAYRLKENNWFIHLGLRYKL